MSICKAGESAPCKNLEPHMLYKARIPQFPDAEVDRSIRREMGRDGKRNATGLPMEIYVDNKFENILGKELEAQGFSGYFYNYPGKEGQRCVGRAASTPGTGLWIPGDELTADSFDADVKYMQDNQWIDEQTAFVQLSCAVEVPNENILMFVAYSVTLSM